jgi:hypothetical protein
MTKVTKKVPVKKAPAKKAPAEKAPAADIDLRSLKAVELREELKKLGLATKGKKAELIERLTEALA